MEAPAITPPDAAAAGGYFTFIARAIPSDIVYHGDELGDHCAALAYTKHETADVDLRGLPLLRQHKNERMVYGRVRDTLRVDGGGVNVVVEIPPVSAADLATAEGRRVQAARLALAREIEAGALPSVSLTTVTEHEETPRGFDKVKHILEISAVAEPKYPGADIVWHGWSATPYDPAQPPTTTLAEVRTGFSATFERKNNLLVPNAAQARISASEPPVSAPPPPLPPTMATKTPAPAAAAATLPDPPALPATAAPPAPSRADLEAVYKRMEMEKLAAAEAAKKVAELESQLAEFERLKKDSAELRQMKRKQWDDTSALASEEVKTGYTETAKKLRANPEDPASASTAALVEDVGAKSLEFIKKAMEGMQDDGNVVFPASDFITTIHALGQISVAASRASSSYDKSIKTISEMQQEASMKRVAAAVTGSNSLSTGAVPQTSNIPQPPVLTPLDQRLKSYTSTAQSIGMRTVPPVPPPSALPSSTLPK